MSNTKSVCTASDNKLGKEIADQLGEFGIKYKSVVISLPAALGAGTRRNSANLNGRLRKFRGRTVRFRKLKQVKVDASRLVRTGAVKAMTYKQAVAGVANTTLLAQGRAVAAAVAPAVCARGQCLDMTLMLAGGTAKRRADPAHDAHMMPIGQWAQAVWHEWLPLKALSKLIASAKRTVRMLQPCEVWKQVKGPATAMVASAQRIGWAVCDASHLVTDEGVSLDLKSDSPVVIERMVQSAVRRWRWRRVATKHSHLCINNQLVQYEAIQGVLNATNLQNHSVDVTKQIQSGLRSALANRQWPQVRC